MRRPCPLAAALCILFLARAFAQTEPAIDHSNLLIYVDDAGTERPVTNVTEWSRRADQIRANMQLVMGPLPDETHRVALDIDVISEERTEHYVRRKIRYTPQPGDRVPAWLLIPISAAPSHEAPAMLCLHQTTAIGRDEPAGLGGRDSLHYAHELANRGFVCIVPDYPSFGEYAYNFKTDGAHYASGTMKAIWNNIRAVDVLQSLPEVDPDRIGAIGHSLGGHNALFTAAFDPRIKAVVSSCGFTAFHDYYGGDLTGWTSDRYMPRIRDVYAADPDRVPFDFYEVIALIAPRAFFSNSPLHDTNFDVTGVRKVFAEVQKVYTLHGLTPDSDRLHLESPDAPHDFPDEQRLAAYQWLHQTLKIAPESP